MLIVTGNNMLDCMQFSSSYLCYVISGTMQTKIMRLQYGYELMTVNEKYLRSTSTAKLERKNECTFAQLSLLSAPSWTHLATKSENRREGKLMRSQAIRRRSERSSEEEGGHEDDEDVL